MTSSNGTPGTVSVDALEPPAYRLDGLVEAL